MIVRIVAYSCKLNSPYFLIIYKTSTWEAFLKSNQQFCVQQPWGKAVGNGVSGIAKIFYELVANGVCPINNIKYFYAEPNVFNAFERTVASSYSLFT